MLPFVFPIIPIKPYIYSYILKREASFRFIVIEYEANKDLWILKQSLPLIDLDRVTAVTHGSCSSSLETIQTNLTLVKSERPHLLQ